MGVDILKLIIENFRKFLAEQNFISGIPLEQDEEGNIILYHVSGAENIEELDPDVAAKNLKNYTTAEYRTWDRPRVFFLLGSDKKILALDKYRAYRIVSG